MYRKWNYSHTYLKDRLLEMLLALSLKQEIIDSSCRDNDINSKINKAISDLFLRISFFDKKNNNREDDILVDISQESISDDQSDQKSNNSLNNNNPN